MHSGSQNNISFERVLEVTNSTHLFTAKEIEPQRSAAICSSKAEAGGGCRGLRSCQMFFYISLSPNKN